MTDIEQRIKAESEARAMAQYKKSLAPTVKPHSGFVSKAALEKRLDQICEIIGKGVGQLVGKRVTKLEEIVAELEERKSLYDAGIWNKEEAYAAGAVVTCDGCAWVAKGKSVGRRPGKSQQWRLMVKSGGVAR